MIEGIPKTQADNIQAEVDSTFLKEVEAKRDLFLTCLNLTEYLHNSDIDTLLLIDRVARPAGLGVLRIWEKLYPDEPRPSIMFINPAGVKDKEDIVAMDDKAIMRFRGKLDSPQGMTRSAWNSLSLMDSIKTREEVRKEMAEKYKNLNQEKDKSVLVFDVCLHTGDSMRTVVCSLRDLGLRNIKTGVATDAHNRSEVVPDFVALDYEPVDPCYVFGPDTLVTKELGQVTSVANHRSSERWFSILRRRKILETLDGVPEEWYDRNFGG